ncbi:MAG: terpene utilization protein AtuA, partial [Comamonas sp.]
AVLRLTACHADKRALELLAREIAPAGTSFAPGTTGAGGRASVSPLIRQYAFLLDKAQLAARVVLDGVDVALPSAPSFAQEGRSGILESNQAKTQIDKAQAAINPKDTATLEVPLIRLAWARSGDKGDTSNIGVIARRPEWLPLLRAQLTPERVKAHLAHAIEGRVTRHEVPGIAAFNFVCEQALGGGGMASLNNDALGKGMAQMLLTLPVRVPADLAQELNTQGE